MNIKQELSNYLKNIPGWRTKRKLVIFSVDDYGNVRLASKAARLALQKKGISFSSHFDSYDTLETSRDLEQLYDVLTSVKDAQGNYAVFTPYALPCNINFEAMVKNNYQEYESELLPETYKKLSEKDAHAYNGAWDIWKEGIAKGIMKPQFHGREHFNLTIFKDLLLKGNENLLTVLKQNSYVTIPEHSDYNHSWTAAYSFDDKKETDGFLNNVADGLKKFKEVYDYDSKVFTPPAQQFPLHLEPELGALGIQYIDCPRSLKRHLGNGQYQMEKHKLGGGTIMTELVRNVVFEPAVARTSDWVNFTFKQIEAAFHMNKPANISSHRVNFCGHIDEKNRKQGLAALKQLLDKIVKRWPDVEFISAYQLGVLISKEK